MAFVSNAAMRLSARVSAWCTFSVLSGFQEAGQFLSRLGSLPNTWGAVNLLGKVVAPFSTPMGNARGSGFSTFPAARVTVRLSDSTHPRRCGLGSPCGSDVHFADSS